MAARSLALLCEAVLEDHFGFYVKAVGGALLNRSLSLKELRTGLKTVCRSSDICRSLAIMEVHSMITFTWTGREVMYSIVPENVLRLVHVPQAVYTTQQLYGDLCGKILNEMAFHGRATFENCVSSLLSQHTYEDCQKAFARLAESQMLRKCDIVVSTEFGVPVMQKHEQPFFFTIKQKVKLEEGGSRKRKLEDDSVNELWCINWPRLNRHLTNELVFNLIRNHKDYKSVDEHLWRSFLYVGETHTTLFEQQSEPFMVSDVCRVMKDSYKQSITWDKADAILLKLTKPSTFSQIMPAIIRKMGDINGGVYVINYAAVFEIYCNQHVESVLLKRIDERAVRIFRLIRTHTNIEEELLPKLAMLAPKEAKEICYLMLENGFIFSRPIARGADFAPSRISYFYAYKLLELVANMIVLCQDSLRNVIFRRLAEVNSNRILLESRQKIDTIVETINSNDEISKEDKIVQAEEVEDIYMTEEDKRKYEKHMANQKLLLRSEIGIAEALFVFQLGPKRVEEPLSVAGKKRASKK